MTDVVETPEVQPAAVVEEQTTASPEGSESATESTEVEATKPEEPKPETDEQRKSKFQRRIERKNADLAAERMRSQMLQERLERLEAQANPRRQDDVPTLDKFDNFEDYMAARVAYEAEKVVETRLGKVQQQEAARRANEVQTKVLTSWQEKQAIAADKYPDFEEVVSESDAPVTQAMSQAIVESDVGADIAYYLAQHPDEAKAIATLSPVRQIAAIGRLEDKVSKPAPRKTTEAPPPIKPTGSKSQTDKDPSEMSAAEFAAWRKKSIAARR